ncbi:ribonuclease T2-like [Aspergillus alliaceus]|uniref:ribonuclease T2 n=1 Tax=Petromyces alliaceus TaxID=209559 RepID=A0A5N7CEJ0_PETAA|nr:ribonuclease T2-like protein [Aspergillus alliaceus]KAF5866088.1 ribonuclease T2-like [Aspergillus burnettii]
MRFTPSLSSTAMVALSAMQLAAGAVFDFESCPADIPFSCQNTTAVSDSCCFNSPGGALLLTQFWDTDPPTGPSDSWTLHGLWPDNCDGSYGQFCDKSREYSNITSILQDQGRTELLSYMQKYWPSYEGDDEEFWEHEWNKHGTCINTIEPSCYKDYSPQKEVGDYLEKAVELFKGLDSYKALAIAGITPDSSKTYKRSEIESALAEVHGGHKPYISCEKGALNQIWYFFNIKGNAITGEYQPIDPLASPGCSSSGIKYLPKSKSNNASAPAWRFRRERANQSVRLD